LAAVAVLLLFAACGGGGGERITNGRYVPIDPMVGMASYSSFEFNGNRVSIGMMNDLLVHDRLRYTFENNTLSVVLDGVSVNIPLEVVDNRTISMAGVEYVRR
jgi:hypothetical protein